MCHPERSAAQPKDLHLSPLRQRARCSQKLQQGSRTDTPARRSSAFNSRESITPK